MAERDSHGRFVKGHVGLSPGRPRGLRDRARQATEDGDLIVAFFRKIAVDETKADSLRMEAMSWLADRGWGKAVQSIEHSGPEGGPMVVLQWHDGNDANDANDPPA